MKTAKIKNEKVRGKPMNVKAEQFKKFLEDQKITVFEIEEMKDDFHTTVFRSRMEVEGQILPMVVILDDSIYGLIRLQIVDKIIKGEKEANLLPYVNKLNQKYKSFKYYVSDDGALLMDTCITSQENNFDGPLIRALIEVILKHMNEEYSELMKKVWSDQEEKKETTDSAPKKKKS